jgi:hypothetical protein
MPGRLVSMQPSSNFTQHSELSAQALVHTSATLQVYDLGQVKLRGSQGPPTGDGQAEVLKQLKPKMAQAMKDTRFKPGSSFGR